MRKVVPQKRRLARSVLERIDAGERGPWTDEEAKAAQYLFAFPVTAPVYHLQPVNGVSFARYMLDVDEQLRGPEEVPV